MSRPEVSAPELGTPDEEEADPPDRAEVLALIAELRPVLDDPDDVGVAPADRLLDLSDLVDALIVWHELFPEDAATVRPDVDAAYDRVRPLAGACESPDDQAFALAVLVDVCELRGGSTDLDEAISSLRAMRALVTEDDDRLDVELKLGDLLWARASVSDWPAGDVSDAIDAYAETLRLLPDLGIPLVAFAQPLSWLFAVRFAAFGGPASDREEAIRLANIYLDEPEEDDEPGVAACHLVIAWMTFSSGIGDQLRSKYQGIAESSPLTQSYIDDLRTLGYQTASADDCEVVLGHLVKIENPAILDEAVPGAAAIIGGGAALALHESGRPVPGLDWVIDELDRVIDLPGIDLQTSELVALRAALLAGRGLREDAGEADVTAASEAVLAANRMLSPDHPLRTPMLGLSGPTLLKRANSARGGGDVAGELDAVLQALEQLPEDAPDREDTITKVGTALLSARHSYRSPPVPSERVIQLLQKVAERREPGDPARVVAEMGYTSVIAEQAIFEHRPEGLDDIEGRLTELANYTPMGHVGRPLTVIGEVTVLIGRYSMSQQLRYLRSAECKLGEALDAISASEVQPADSARSSVHEVRGLLRLVRYHHSPQDLELLRGSISDLELAVELTSKDSAHYTKLVAELGTARALADIHAMFNRGEFLQPVSTVAKDGFDQVLAAAREVTPEHPQFSSLTAQAATGIILQAIPNRDRVKFDAAISMLAAACSVPGITPREAPALSNMHGFALLTRYQFFLDANDLNHAIDRLEDARRSLDQVDGSPHASTVLQSLAGAYRLRGDAKRGDVDRAVLIGLASLREHVGDVLMQDSDENALNMARGGAEDALEMARWFLTRGRPEPAISAIEFGRGLVLNAATIGDEFPDLLRQAGHDALAHEWDLERSQPDLLDPDRAGDLRYRTLLAIEGSETEARLLAAPTVEDIRAALAATATDALIYLLPKDEIGSGLAVVVDRAGAVTSIPLPGLRIGPGHPLTVCEQTRREADRLADERSPDQASARRRWREALGELCDWAWLAAIGPLGGMPVLRSGGPSRVVLVPIGQLGLVPWHASRHTVDARPRYACQEIVFSYASSARQFIDAAGLMPRPWPERPVLVTDSTGSTYATSAAIDYIRASYYPNSTVFGSARRLVPADVPGSLTARPADVLAAMAGTASGGASVLHFGCHGKAGLPVLDSSLDLGAGGKLAVREILHQARRSARTEFGGLVVLAACLSDRTESDYDEALTLSTAFLSAGSSGVLGARWRVTEDHTALFMAQFHRALNLDSTDPAEALRATQLWMLDPDRSPLPGLPKVLGEEVSQPDLADPIGWAAFAYQGR
ncbi:MAG TPA: CHAT domain-containing protein [Streptosporangiaceae bacterium]|nr:CHAT domain-containing protein [Streptosporangiaceae bacterium]